MTAVLETAPPAAPAPSAEPVERLSYFFPAHNEEANLEPLVAEALERLPALARTFEIVIVDDGSRDATPGIADRLAAEHPDLVRAVHHPVNLGYGAALRSGFQAARYDVVAFTDGDRQFKVADLGLLTTRLARDDSPDVVVGYRIRRADPLVRTLYARAYRFANLLFFRLRLRDVDCACKVFRRSSLEGLRVEFGRGLLLGRAAHQAPGERPDRRRGGRAALPADGRFGDRRAAPGRAPGRARLLAPAPAPLGEPLPGPAPWPADGRRPQGLNLTKVTRHLPFGTLDAPCAGPPRRLRSGVLLPR